MYTIELEQTRTMASEAKSIGLQFLRRVQGKLLTDDRETYDKFVHVLKQFRIRNLPSSDVVEIINKLFHNHPDLLLDFKPLMPRKYAAAAAAAASNGDDDSRASAVDFVKRIEARFNSDSNGLIYRAFLDCMDSYARGKFSISEVRDRVVGLFAGHHDLAAEFVTFLPGSCEIDVQRKRKLNSTPADADEGIRVSEPIEKRRILKPKKYVDEETQGVAPPQRRESGGKSPCSGGEKGVRVRAVNEVEESLVHVEVQIGQLASTYASAVELTRRLWSGELSVEDVRVEEHLTALNLMCVRKQCRRIVVGGDQIRVDAMAGLMECLMKKKEALEKSRTKLLSKMRESLLHVHSL